MSDTRKSNTPEYTFDASASGIKVYVGEYSGAVASNIYEFAKGISDSNPEELSHALLGEAALVYEPDKNISELRALTDDEIQSLTTEELNSFSKIFYLRNPWLNPRISPNERVMERRGESDIDYLFRAFQSYSQYRLAEARKTVDKIKPFWGYSGSAKEDLTASMWATGSMQDHITSDISSITEKLSGSQEGSPESHILSIKPGARGKVKDFTECCEELKKITALSEDLVELQSASLISNDNINLRLGRMLEEIAGGSRQAFITSISAIGISVVLSLATMFWSTQANKSSSVKNLSALGRIGDSVAVIAAQHTQHVDFSKAFLSYLKSDSVQQDIMYQSDTLHRADIIGKLGNIKSEVEGLNSSESERRKFYSEMQSLGQSFVNSATQKDSTKE